MLHNASKCLERVYFVSYVWTTLVRLRPSVGSLQKYLKTCRRNDEILLYIIFSHLQYPLSSYSFPILTYRLRLGNGFLFCPAFHHCFSLVILFSTISFISQISILSKFFCFYSFYSLSIVNHRYILFHFLLLHLLNFPSSLIHIMAHVFHLPFVLKI
jgi:hypothetical protein